jgi:hypothetical protein
MFGAARALHQWSACGRAWSEQRKQASAWVTRCFLSPPCCRCGRTESSQAAAPAQGYFLGAFLYLGIVFSLPATLGVASLALDLPARPGRRAGVASACY